MSFFSIKKTNEQSSNEQKKHIEPVKTEKSLVFERVRPSLMIGISTKNPDISKQTDLDMQAFFGDSGHCDCCGIFLTKQQRKTLSVFSENGNPGYHNVCGLCYYTCNIDEIPHLEKGRIMYQPSLSQIGVFTLIRAKTSLGIRTKLAPQSAMNSPEMIGLMDAEMYLSSYLHRLSNQNKSTSESSGETVDTFVHAMDLLTDEQYANRGKLFCEYIWLPDINMVKKEFDDGVSSQFDIFVPEQADEAIDAFINKYVPNMQRVADDSIN